MNVATVASATNALRNAPAQSPWANRSLNARYRRKRP